MRRTRRCSSTREPPARPHARACALCAALHRTAHRAMQCLCMGPELACLHASGQAGACSAAVCSLSHSPRPRAAACMGMRRRRMAACAYNCLKPLPRCAACVGPARRLLASSPGRPATRPWSCMHAWHARTLPRHARTHAWLAGWLQVAAPCAQGLPPQRPQRLARLLWLQALLAGQRAAGGAGPAAHRLADTVTGGGGTRWRSSGAGWLVEWPQLPLSGAASGRHRPRWRNRSAAVLKPRRAAAVEACVRLHVA